MEGYKYIGLFIVIFTVAFQANLATAQKPIVCFTAPERLQALDIANTIANIVDSSLQLGSALFKDPAKRAQYTNVVNQVLTALRNGWAASGVCDSIANPIADPLAVIPFVGPLIVPIVKIPIKGACELRKQELGC